MESSLARIVIEREPMAKKRNDLLRRLRSIHKLMESGKPYSFEQSIWQEIIEEIEQCRSKWKEALDHWEEALDECRKLKRQRR